LISDAPRDLPTDRPVLQAERLACRRGGRRLLSGFDLRLEPGDAIWLRGPNGSGKTSLLRVLAGLSRPDAGEARFAGQPVHALSPVWRGRLRFVGHANALKSELRVGEALAFLAGLSGNTPTHGQTLSALARVGLERRVDAFVGALSQGQRRKVALARLMMDDAPHTWLLDEPQDALDDDGLRVFDDWLATHIGRGGAVMLTSHIPLRTAGLRVVELQAGAGTHA
jgi:heme exporter protein A